MASSFFISKIVFVPKQMEAQLKAIMSDEQILQDQLFIHLDKLYELDPTTFVEKDSFAYMDTDFDNMDNEPLYAFFSRNQVPNKQKWYLSEFKTLSQIEKLVNPTGRKENKTELNSAIKQAKPEKIESKNFVHDSKIIEPNEDDSLKLTIDPIMRNILDSYREEHCPKDMRDGYVYGRLVNQAVLENDTPNCIADDEDLLDAVCVDALYDTGIDGLCIFVNDKIVRSVNHLQDIIHNDKAITSTEIIFIQSKFQKEFTLDGVSKFILGIMNFFQSESSRKLNDKMKAWFDIKNAILENIEYTSEMTHILVRVFYAAYGKWTNSSEILGSFSTMENFISSLNNGLYKFEKPVFIGADEIKLITKYNNRYFEPEVTFENGMLPFSKSEKVEGVAARIKATELLKILIDPTTNLLRKGLFDENVRDYQGETKVNLSIKETIKDAPESFIFRNNGITILANKLSPASFTSLKLVNPQIVNGCQTCNVIYYAYKEGLPIDKVEIFARIISTDDIQTITSIVSGNNNQNIVYDMINEISREYHKKLEEFFLCHKERNSDRQIFYERRSKSLERENLRGYQRCTFRSLIQSSTAIWFDAPYYSLKGESELLEIYKNRVFSDIHKEICYYAAAALFANYDRLISENRLDSGYRKMKANVCYLIKNLLANGEVIELHNESSATAFSEKILELLNDDEKFAEYVNKALIKLENAKQKWFEDLGEEHLAGIFDDPKFQKYLLSAADTKKIEKKTQEVIPTYSGRITRIARDKTNQLICWIETSDYSRVWAHSYYSPNCDFADLQTGESVIFKLESNPSTDFTAKMAVDVEPAFS